MLIKVEECLWQGNERKADDYRDMSVADSRVAPRGLSHVQMMTGLASYVWKCDIGD